MIVKYQDHRWVGYPKKILTYSYRLHWNSFAIIPFFTTGALSTSLVAPCVRIHLVDAASGYRWGKPAGQQCVFNENKAAWPLPRENPSWPLRQFRNNPAQTSQYKGATKNIITQRKVFNFERRSSTTIRGPRMSKFGSTVGFLLIYSVFFAQLRIPILVCQFKTLPPVIRWNSFTLWAVNTEDSFCYANTIKISISDKSKSPFVKAQTETHRLFLLLCLVFCCCF